MAEQNPEKKAYSLSDEAMAAAYEAEHQPTHDQKWAALQASDAPMIRKALVRAEEVRAEELDPGDAYLQAIADFRYYQDRLALIESTRQTLRELSETPEVDPDE